MPVTASVSVSKKISLPDFGSLGASCSVQFEVEPNSLQREPAALGMQHVRFSGRTIGRTMPRLARLTIKNRERGGVCWSY